MWKFNETFVNQDDPLYDLRKLIKHPFHEIFSHPVISELASQFFKLLFVSRLSKVRSNYSKFISYPNANIWSSNCSNTGSVDHPFEFSETFWSQNNSKWELIVEAIKLLRDRIVCLLIKCVIITLMCHNYFNFFI